MKLSNVWIIDDDPIYQVIAKKFFGKHGPPHTLSAYQNGEKALETLKGPEPLPDIILLDINMPAMDGWEFLDEYSQLSFGSETVRPRVFLVSSSIAFSDQAKAKRYACLSGHLKKPLTTDILQLLFPEGN
jgi:CheY-like chemotaxis protein